MLTFPMNEFCRFVRLPRTAFYMRSAYGALVVYLQIFTVFYVRFVALFVM